MRVLRYRTPTNWTTGPVSVFVRREMALSAKVLAEVKYEGGIRVNGVFCHANTALSPGDLLELYLPEDLPAPPPLSAGEGTLPFPILYEDEDYLIVQKPPDMPVHPSPGHDSDSLHTALTGYYARTGQRCRIRPLYRLDKDTSGLLALAKHRAAAGAVLSKTYLAVCQGELAGQGTVDAPIRLAEGSKILRACGEGPGAQSALTHWRSLAQGDGHTLLALWLGTGRTHQIRAHMAYLSYPLAGDELYGGSRARMGRQALHCCFLRVKCRALNFNRTFASPLPEDILQSFPWTAEPSQLYITKEEENKAW